MAVTCGWEERVSLYCRVCFILEWAVSDFWLMFTFKWVHSRKCTSEWKYISISRKSCLCYQRIHRQCLIGQTMSELFHCKSGNQPLNWLVFYSNYNILLLWAWMLWIFLQNGDHHTDTRSAEDSITAVDPSDDQSESESPFVKFSRKETNREEFL